MKIILHFHIKVRLLNLALS